MRLRALALAVALAVAAGCSSTKTTIEVESTQETNGGRPFYVVVRAIDQAVFVTDGYDVVAQKVFQQPPDKSVLRSEVVYPGKTLEFKVDKPEVTPLAVYFLFNSPGDKWKTSYSQPVPSSVGIELDGNQIKSDR